MRHVKFSGHANPAKPWCEAIPEDADILRIVRLAPFLEGRGKVYALAMWSTNRTDRRGQTIIAYAFGALDEGAIFEGADFAGSPMHADDADETVRSLLTFLTLRPGDTDADYFEGYSAEQMAFAEGDAEALSMFAMDPSEMEGECESLEDIELSALA